jgi:hypothetical protein
LQDSLARIILEIVETRRSNQETDRAAVFHFVNPTAVPWSSLLPAVHSQFPAQAVSFAEFTEALAMVDPTPEEIAAKPAVKLLEFFRGMSALDGQKYFPVETTKTRAASESMRNLQPITVPLMKLYLNQWGL